MRSFNLCFPCNAIKLLFKRNTLILTIKFLLCSLFDHLKIFMKQAITEGIELLKVSVRKLSPFGIPLAGANMSGAMLAMDLVRHFNCCYKATSFVGVCLDVPQIASGLDTMA